jgi:hypothetical protein
MEMISFYTEEVKDEIKAVGETKAKKGWLCS